MMIECVSWCSIFCRFEFIFNQDSCWNKWWSPSGSENTGKTYASIHVLGIVSKAGGCRLLTSCATK